MPTDHRETFDRVVCINLDRRPDRWRDFMNRVSQPDWPFSEPQRFRAINGDAVPHPPWFNGGNGAWGCLQSHVRILEDAMQDGVESLLILEDDALFNEGFSEGVDSFLANVPADWDGLMLGGQHLATPYNVKEGVVRVANGNRTHAHALRGRYIKAVYRYLLDAVGHAKTPTFHVDHRLGTLHFSRIYNIYAPTPWLVGQAAESSDITGRLEVERFWQQDPPASEDVENLTNRSRDRRELPIIALLGPYLSGAPQLANQLESLGGYLGFANNAFAEDQYLADLCRNSYTEPTFVELLPRTCRSHLMKQWVAQLRSTAPLDSKFLVANHPMLAFLADELWEAGKGKVTFVHIDIDPAIAGATLESHDWQKFRNRAMSTQSAVAEQIRSIARLHRMHAVPGHHLEGRVKETATDIVSALAIPM